jgi:hypothetical protein
MRGRCHTILGGCVIMMAAAMGCYTAPGLETTPASNGGTTTEIANAETTSAVSDLPCDVANVLASACTSCHGPVLADGARVHLASRADLLASIGGGSSATIADLCVQRMQHETKPMPPNAQASPNAVTVFEKWIAAGMPEGTCSALGIDYTTESVCSSNRRWKGDDDDGDKLMNPGEACIACHKQEAAEGSREAKVYSVAGTLYPTAHEPDDCNGVNGTKGTKPKVVITDAKGTTVTLEVNSAGNFYYERSLSKPLRAKVVRGDAVYEMQAEIKDGDCNACHTEAGRADEGVDYPRGRIVSP